MQGRALEPQLYSAPLPRVPAPIAYHYTQFIQCNVIVMWSQTKLSWDLSFLAATSRNNSDAKLAKWSQRSVWALWICVGQNWIIFLFCPPTLQTLVFCLSLPNVSYLGYLNTGGRQQWQPGLHEHILLSEYFFIGTWMLWDTACSISGFLLGKSQGKVLNFLEVKYSNARQDMHAFSIVNPTFLFMNSGIEQVL